MPRCASEVCVCVCVSDVCTYVCVCVCVSCGCASIEPPPNLACLLQYPQHPPHSEVLFHLSTSTYPTKGLGHKNGVRCDVMEATIHAT